MENHTRVTPEFVSAFELAEVLSNHERLSSDEKAQIWKRLEHERIFRLNGNFRELSLMYLKQTLPECDLRLLHEYIPALRSFFEFELETDSEPISLKINARPKSKNLLYSSKCNEKILNELIYICKNNKFNSILIKYFCKMHCVDLFTEFHFNKSYTDVELELRPAEITLSMCKQLSEFDIHQVVIPAFSDFVAVHGTRVAAEVIISLCKSQVFDESSIIEFLIACHTKLTSNRADGKGSTTHSADFALERERETEHEVFYFSEAIWDAFLDFPHGAQLFISINFPAGFVSHKGERYSFVNKDSLNFVFAAREDNRIQTNLLRNCFFFHPEIRRDVLLNHKAELDRDYETLCLHQRIGKGIALSAISANLDLSDDDFESIFLQTKGSSDWVGKYIGMMLLIFGSGVPPHVRYAFSVKLFEERTDVRLASLLSKAPWHLSDQRFPPLDERNFLRHCVYTGAKALIQELRFSSFHSDCVTKLKDLLDGIDINVHDFTDPWQLYRATVNKIFNKDAPTVEDEALSKSISAAFRSSFHEIRALE